MDIQLSPNRTGSNRSGDTGGFDIADFSFRTLIIIKNR